MNNFEVHIWYDEAAVCSFYTVSWVDAGDGSSSETDKFFDFYAVPEHPLQDDAMQLFRLITESIGNKYGAIDAFFDRNEARAQALPPKPKRSLEEIIQLGINFPLRLFCYRITEQIVVLFNGGFKDVAKVQEDHELLQKFRDAQIFAKRIEQALQDGLITISQDKRYLEVFDGADHIIL